MNNSTAILHGSTIFLLSYFGDWDEIGNFQTRVGGNPLWQEDNYLEQHTDEAVRKIKEHGDHMAIIHFYKGFGLEAEKEQLEDSKTRHSCVKSTVSSRSICRQYSGLRKMLLEKPEAEEWFVPIIWKHRSLWGNQTFRKRVYFMHPGYIEYMKEY